MNKNYPVLLFIKKNEIGFSSIWNFFVILNFINERLIFVLLVVSVVRLI
ncbi:hypothetical protein CMALT430_160223 [Carnobacterium maltaromaticum]|nr:hypothetical protein CMALT430_160223 [Carnobacterium maltaromaticum]